MAAPILRAQRASGEAGVRAAIDQVIGSIRSVCLLTGSKHAADLARAPRHLGAPLRAFLDDLGLSAGVRQR
jgi:isopentenyl diphosphate isomerase/L-lactate dehydrogenase-like FMN-dependent dehydrogenase